VGRGTGLSFCLQINEHAVKWACFGTNSLLQPSQTRACAGTGLGTGAGFGGGGGAGPGLVL
jgi:hypothetical protein